MPNFLKNLNWPKLNKLLWIFIIFYIIFVFSICLFKYFTFSYNGLDLAIYNQVFYNSSLGRFFQFTIHPTSYLGDHFEIIIFLLIPFYALFKSPLTLLFIQTLFISLAVIPLYLIAKKYLTPLLSLLVIVLYLFNTITLNINIFEFHILALAPFFIFWTFYFFEQNKFTPFLALALLSLLVREDMAFVIFMFGLLAIFNKKSLHWIFTPLVLASAYFYTAFKLISYFSSAQTYKFIVYYQWLGSTPQEIMINFFLKFPLVLQHVFTLANFEFVLGFLLVFLFIPLYRPKYLLLGLGMAAEIMLGNTSGNLILKTHFGAIILSAFCLAFIFSLKDLQINLKFQNLYKKYQDIILLIICLALVYNFLALGPLLPFIKKVFTTDYQQVALKNEFIKKIPATASLIAPYDLIPNLSSRAKLYSLNYAFLGKQQYDAGDYIIPNDTQFLLINFDDLLTYHIQYEVSAKNFYDQGPANLRNLLEQKNFQLVLANKNLALWEKEYQSTAAPLYQTLDKLPELQTYNAQKLDALEFLGANQNNNQLSLYFKAEDKIAQNYFIVLNKQIYPLGYGFYPTSKWQSNQLVQINFFGLPTIKKAELINVSGSLELDGLGSVENALKQAKIIGQLNLE